MNIIILNGILILFSASAVSHADIAISKTLDDFDKNQAAGTWISVNDGVMGGVSKGGPKVSKQHNLIFKGDISLENNGGFSSTRTEGETMDLSAYDGIEIKVNGDGRMYYFTTRSSGRRMLAFWSPIQPAKDEWTVIRIPFASFYATYRGKKIPAMRLNIKKNNKCGIDALR